MIKLKRVIKRSDYMNIQYNTQIYREYLIIKVPNEYGYIIVMIYKKLPMMRGYIHELHVKYRIVKRNGGKTLSPLTKIILCKLPDKHIKKLFIFRKFGCNLGLLVEVKKNESANVCC